MTAHDPITAGQALAMVEAIGVSDARRPIAYRTAAGLVKSYTLMIEAAEVDSDAESLGIRLEGRGDGNVVSSRATRAPGYDNRHRIHSDLACLTPEQAEQRMTS